MADRRDPVIDERRLRPVYGNNYLFIQHNSYYMNSHCYLL